jgi:hypothetical protein
MEYTPPRGNHDGGVCVILAVRHRYLLALQPCDRRRGQIHLTRQRIEALVRGVKVEQSIVFMLVRFMQRHRLDLQLLRHFPLRRIQRHEVVGERVELVVDFLERCITPSLDLPHHRDDELGMWGLFRRRRRIRLSSPANQYQDLYDSERNFDRNRKLLRSETLHQDFFTAAGRTNPAIDLTSDTNCNIPLLRRYSRA